jgi:hypothetical protein
MLRTLARLTSLFIGILVLQCQAHGQQFTRLEIGANTSILPHNRLSSFTDSGLGGRATFNFSPAFSLDSEVNLYFTNFDQRFGQSGGRAIVGLIGPKAGVRTERYGLFLKARPGFMSFSDAAANNNLSTARKTHAALDLGVTAEYYLTNRILFRADFGKLLVRYGESIAVNLPNTLQVINAGAIGGPYHIELGAGYRFGALRQEREPLRSPGTKFTIGGQYSLFSSDRGLDTERDESGIGGWFTWNFNKYFGWDSAITFFPRKIHIADFQQGGRTFQVLSGLRGGIRTGRLGVFGKFRPGIQSYSLTAGDSTSFQLSRFTDIAFDTGGIFEVYVSPKILLRFDAGNTTIHYRGRDLISPPGKPLHVPGFTNNTIQVTSGIGFRF